MGHAGSVFCCSVEPKEGKLVVSGGEDDKAYVWSITDGEVLFECGNHQDSVTSALFSHDGSYLASADMGGFIQVWKIATKSVVWSFETGDLNVSFTYPLSRLEKVTDCTMLFLYSGWIGTQHPLSCLLVLFQVKLGCGKFPLVTAKHFQVMEREMNVGKSFLMVLVINLI